MATRSLFFVVGFLSEFTALAEMYLMRDLGLDVAECYMAATVIDLVWFVRPWLGNCSDRLGKRHLQLAVVFLLAFVCCMLTSAIHTVVVVFFLMITECAVAIGLTVADAYVVRLAKADPMVMPQHHRWRLLGCGLAAACSAVMLTVPEHLRNQRTHQAYVVQGAVFLVSGVFSFVFLKSNESYVQVETSQQPESSTYNETKSYEWNVFHLAWSDDVVKSLVLFLMIMSTLPSSSTAVSYFMIGSIGISPATFAIMDIIRVLCNVAATFMDPTLEAKQTMMAQATTMFLMTIPMMMLVCRTVAPVLDDRWLLFPNVAMQNFAGMFLSMATSINVSRVAPAGKEGGTYNGIVSIPSLGQIVGVPLTFFLTKYFQIDHDEFTYLPSFVALTSVLCAIPLLYASL